MILASISSFLGSVWFAVAVGLVGFIGGWWASRKKCSRH